MGALLHGDEHDVGNAHNAAHEGEEAQDPQEGADITLGVVHLHVVRIAVLDPDAPPVVRRDVMPEPHGTRVFLFEGFVVGLRLRTVHCECDAFDFVAGIVDAFVGGVGNRAKAGHVHFIGMVDAHHAEGDRPGTDPLTQDRVRILRREFLGLGEADDDHLPPLRQIVRVQEATGVHLQLLLFHVVGHDARNSTCDCVSVQGEGDGGGPCLAGDVAHGGGPSWPFRVGDVLLVQLDITPFLVAGVRL